MLGHVVCHDGMLIDLSKVVIILNLRLPTIVKQLIETLGHTRYYGNFIKEYAEVTAPMEMFLKKLNALIFTGQNIVKRV